MKMAADNDTPADGAITPLLGIAENPSLSRISAAVPNEKTDIARRGGFWRWTRAIAPDAPTAKWFGSANIAEFSEIER